VMGGAPPSPLSMRVDLSDWAKKAIEYLDLAASSGRRTLCRLLHSFCPDQRASMSPMLTAIPPSTGFTAVHVRVFFGSPPPPLPSEDDDTAVRGFAQHSNPVSPGRWNSSVRLSQSGHPPPKKT